MAPYIGVSLETFTGIIGVVLAGIALGAWAGGVAADQLSPKRLLGPAIVLGGILAWLSLPIVRVLGPQFSGSGSIPIIILSTAGFFAPAAVLSAVTPLVAKLRLRTIEETGAVVGGLSAAGTLGALAGTFLTGFFLVQALPVTPLVIGLGAVLVASGLVLHWYLMRSVPSASLLIGAVVAGAVSPLGAPPCQFETGYACVRVIADADNPSSRSLILDSARHAHVDLDDPTNLDIRYTRLFAQVIDQEPEGPIDTLHVGGGGFSMPRYLQHTRPGSTDVVLEIDPELVRVGQQELGLELSDQVVVRTGDARLTIEDEPTGGYDVVIGDAYAGLTVPWHLTTTEFFAEVARVLRPDGIFVLNLIDGDENRFARAEVATALEHFDHATVIVPSTGIPGNRPVNQVAVVSNRATRGLSIDADDGVVLSADEFADWLGTDPLVLRDDYAPVDQLRLG